jgi:hypothetical protein
MTLTVVELPATTTIDINNVFTMQGLFNTIYGTLPSSDEYTITGISIPLLGMSCKTDGVINTYMDIKDAVARLYNYLMKSYLQPIWIVIENLLKALEAIVGGLFNIDLTLPVLNLTVSDLFSDNLYNRLITSITNLYNNALDQLKTILNVLGIPFKPYDDTDSPETTIASIVKNIMVSLWGSLIRKIADIIGAIKTGLFAYDSITTPGAFPPPLGTLWESIVDAVLAKIAIFFASGGPTVQEIFDALVAFVKLALDKTVVTAQEILDYLTNFTLPIFGRPFDWDLPFQGGVESPQKNLEQLLADIKNYCTNYIGLILAQFVKAISAILSIFGLNFTLPVLSISYTVCAVRNDSIA